MLLRNSEKDDTFFNFSHMKTLSWLVPCSVYVYVHSQTNHSTLKTTMGHVLRDHYDSIVFSNTETQFTPLLDALTTLKSKGVPSLQLAYKINIINLSILSFQVGIHDITQYATRKI